jgi:hypothetical protein
VAQLVKMQLLDLPGAPRSRLLQGLDLPDLGLLHTISSPLAVHGSVSMSARRSTTPALSWRRRATQATLIHERCGGVVELAF